MHHMRMTITANDHNTSNHHNNNNNNNSISNSKMNNSLSSLFDGMDLSPSKASNKGSYNCDNMSIGTKDSLTKNKSSSNDAATTTKSSKRGTTKKSLLGGNDASFSENSYMETFGYNSFNDSKGVLESSGSSLFGNNSNSNKNSYNHPDLNIGGATTKVTSTAKEGSTPKRTKRGGKKAATSDDSKPDLERSLSGLVFDEEDGYHDPRGVPNDCRTVSTMDSIDREKNGTSSRTTKRGGKKNTNGPSDLEKSLSDLNFVDSVVDIMTNTDCPTVCTMDSIQREKMSLSNSKPMKRGGKKPSNGSSSNLERSLSELNFDTTDDNMNIGKNDCPTVCTMDSIQQRDNKAIGGGTKTTKRGGKKSDTTTSHPQLFQPQPYEKSKSTSLASSLNKLGGPPRDFGRQADDNDTFCDVGDSSNMKMTTTTKMEFPVVMKTTTPTFGISNDDDSDDDDENEEDLFSSFPGNNPFRLPTYL